jgi:hypothetical protein
MAGRALLEELLNSEGRPDEDIVRFTRRAAGGRSIEATALWADLLRFADLVAAIREEQPVRGTVGDFRTTAGTVARLSFYTLPLVEPGRTPPSRPTAGSG